MSFDINSDIGEGFGNWKMGRDDEVMPLLTSANVACGFHAGDPLTIARTVKLAVENDVAVGAHPGFPDLLGFGRRTIALTPDEAAAYVRYQAGAIREFLRPYGRDLNHVKPHGAFFALMRDDVQLAAPVADVIASLGENVMAYWPAPAEGVRFCEELVERGVTVIGEFYPDLRYGPDGKIIIEPVKQMTDLDFARYQTNLFLTKGVVETTDGSQVPLTAGSACIHSDGPNAPEVAQAVRAVVKAAGYEIATPTTNERSV